MGTDTERSRRDQRDGPTRRWIEERHAYSSHWTNAEDESIDGRTDGDTRVGVDGDSLIVDRQSFIEDGAVTDPRTHAPRRTAVSVLRMVVAWIEPVFVGSKSADSRHGKAGGYSPLDKRPCSQQESESKQVHTSLAPLCMQA
jgi:hypothetical protein